MSIGHALWAERAWIDGQWRSDVAISILDDRFHAIQPGTPCPADARRLDGPVLPGVVNAHSHAFQRAFAGLAERRSTAHDDFWSWRDRMYGVALRITPEQLRTVAAQLYAELLQGGYTQVCEFHYLQHAPDGSRYADPFAMARALADAAAEVGIGLTLLPVLYERAGFAQPALRDDQRRFATTVDDVLALRREFAGAGLAIHSLRAARPESIARLADAAGPIHIHIAEQTGEVDDCLAATGQRPIEWLAQHVALDARWQLVHATHATAGEIAAVAASGAGVVLCPSTEANLGDGLPDLPRWLAHDAVLAIGSDSHVGRQWPRELRLLEEGQRLQLRQRNVAAAPAQGEPSTAAHLFERCVAGGAAAAGFDRWGLVEGQRADLLVLDMQAPGLVGLPAGHALDALVFATDGPALREVWVGGRQVVSDGRAIGQDDIRARFAETMRALWGAASEAEAQ